MKINKKTILNAFGGLQYFLVWIEKFFQISDFKGKFFQFEI